MTKMFESRVASDERRHQESPAFPSTKGSYHPLEEPLADPSPTPVPGEPSTLYLDAPLLRVVADALVHTHATTHHHKQIPQHLRRVTVTCVREGEEGTAVPVPEPEVDTIGQAFGSFILWPQNLIGTAALSPPMVGTTSLTIYFSSVGFLLTIFFLLYKDDQDAAKWPFLARLQQVYKGIRQVGLHMPPGIVGMKDYPYTIDSKDLKEFIKLEEIDVSWVKFAIRSVVFSNFSFN